MVQERMTRNRFRLLLQTQSRNPQNANRNPEQLTMANKPHPSEQSGSGNLDYGANKPTGGTQANTGKINPQGPTSGTENFHPDKQGNEQSAAHEDKEAEASRFTKVGSDSPRDDGRNAQDWQRKNINLASDAPGNLGAGPVSPNAGDIQDESGNLRPGASATAGAGAGAIGDRHSYRCSDAGFGDCRWEVASASSNEIWADIEKHHRDAHGKPTLDEASRGRIQDAIHVRRAA